ncbi:phosphoribosylanthranilate isomerase [Commensalibacter oyaizuii]|uniref:N-(5'-phosphoribosyl)anthranilate isomerase n=1 Tax=Commensalibacter oyaizuii TaxID=3043873 RepID=A0ABT6Q1S0_9PROT|nr:phosphoribosylanthranilate isomerase [Commensalibacter sp. TBRC 16381]MDI2091029.1 phosphoribosylanthranilate isomerase [Commensalibacter sp. TBRC 16381]
MTAIKICGVKDSATYDLLAELQVNWVGIVFYPPSPRYIEPSQAALLPDYKADGLQRVGLFVKPTVDDIRRILDYVHLDVLQLYTSMENASVIQTIFGIPVWVAKGVKSRADLPTSCPVTGMVIEAPANQSDSRPGGNGRVFDWQLTKNWQAPRPWLLAGGLTPENVTTAIVEAQALAVDVSSGVERCMGEKDPVLIRSFVENIRKKI